MNKEIQKLTRELIEKINIDNLQPAEIATEPLQEIQTSEEDTSYEMELELEPSPSDKELVNRYQEEEAKKSKIIWTSSQ